MAQTHSLDLESTSSQYASITDASQTGLDLTTDFTLEAWVKLEAFGGADKLIISKYNSTGNQKAYHLAYIDVAGTKKLRLGISSNGSADDGLADFAVTLTEGVWYHIAATYDVSAGTAEMYVNGKSLGTNTGNPTTIFNSSADFAVGMINAGAQPWDGLIKDVRVFNDIRTQSEIVSDAHTENVSDANLQGEWNFNNAYTDASGNGNTLTATNSPTFVTTIPWTAPADGQNVQFSANMVSWWTLDETSGTRADAHSTNDLTDNNTVLSAVGKWDNAADFELTNSEYLSITDASQTGLDITGDISFSLFVNFESLPTSGSFATFINKGKEGLNSTLGYVFLLQNDAGVYKLRVQLGTGTTNEEYRVDWTPSLGTWYHIVYSYNNTSKISNFYINGAQRGSPITGTLSGINNNTENFQLGADINSSSVAYLFFDGLQDEVSIYNAALDYGNVLDLYNAGTGIPYVAAAVQPRPPAINSTGSFMIM